MQYKTSTKLIIDKRKLDTLFRLGCPDEKILEVIKTGTFSRTGDKLMDETLESLVDIKDFSNWGGNHNPTGRNQWTKTNKSGQVGGQLGGQVVQQDGGQLGGQLGGQVVDIDKDILRDRGCRGKEKNTLTTPREFKPEYIKTYKR